MRQGDRYAVHFALLLRCALLQKGLDDDMRYEVGMSPDLIDFYVRETIGIGSEQIATSSNRYRLGVQVVIVFHGRSTSDPQNE